MEEKDEGKKSLQNEKCKKGYSYKEWIVVGCEL
jgi:hypothetical protein